jgi:hypothetical protein
MTATEIVESATPLKLNARAFAANERQRHGESSDALQTELRREAAASKASFEGSMALVKATRDEITVEKAGYDRLGTEIESITAIRAKWKPDRASELAEQAKHGAEFTFPNAQAILLSDLKIELLREAQGSLRERIAFLESDTLIEREIEMYDNHARADYDEAEFIAYQRLLDLGPAITAAGGMPMVSVVMHMGYGAVGELRDTMEAAIERSLELRNQLHKNQHARYRQEQEKTGWRG